MHSPKTPTLENRCHGRRHKGSRKSNLTFWTPMHPVRLPVQKFGISRYSCDSTPCRPGVSTSKIMNLFFREPLAPWFCIITARWFCPLVIYRTQELYFSWIWQFVNRKSLVFLEIMEIFDFWASAFSTWVVRRQGHTISQYFLKQAKLKGPREFITKCCW